MLARFFMCINNFLLLAEIITPSYIYYFRHVNLLLNIKMKL